MLIVHKGKTIEVPDSHGRLLIKNGRATAVKGEKMTKVVPERVADTGESSTATTTKRAYKRRDMKAEG